MKPPRASHRMSDTQECVGILRDISRGTTIWKVSRFYGSFVNESDLYTHGVYGSNSTAD